MMMCCAHYEISIFTGNDIGYDIYLLTAIGLTPGGTSTVHIYTQTIHRATQLNVYILFYSGFLCLGWGDMQGQRATPKN